MTDDISISLGLGARVIVPIPDKGTIGIEIPNDSPKIVGLSYLLQTPEYLENEALLPIAIGMDVEGDCVVADLANMPHLLVAGATGQGKSVFLNTLIVSLLAAKESSELQLLLFDPKAIEFSQYHSLAESYLLKIDGIEESVITNIEDVKVALDALCAEMDRRYTLLNEANVKNIHQYNEIAPNKLRYIVAVIDEYADLIMTLGKDFEKPIARLAQKARAAGIHVILATQRPSKNVVTGVIKASFPSRIAFRVNMRADSKTILDREGADNLLGRGDMLFLNNSCVTRLQGAIIDAPEIARVVKSLSEYCYGNSSNLHIRRVERETIVAESHNSDTLFDKAVKFLASQEFASTSMLQHKFGIGYNRASRLIDKLEVAGILGPARGCKPREILINTDGTFKPSKELLRDFSLEEIEAKLTEIPMLARGFVMMQYRKDFDDKLYVKDLIDAELDNEHPLRELVWNHTINDRFNIETYVKAILSGKSELIAEKEALVRPKIFG